MGTSPDYAPYEFLVNRNGKNQVVGLDAQIAQKIADDIGVKLQIKQMDFDSCWSHWKPVRSIWCCLR